MNKKSAYENSPLEGKRIVVTRSSEQAGGLVKSLSALGAHVIELPVIKLVDPDDKKEFVESVIHAHTYDWLIFTSSNGVCRFFDAFYATYKDARSLGGVRIAAVGPETKKMIESYRFAVDLMPDRYVAEGLLEAFKKNITVDSLTFLWIRPEEARSVLYDGLVEMQAIVDECVAYKVEAEDSAKGIESFVEQGADMITFTSASTVKYFNALGLPWPEGCKAASIGPVTSAQLKELGQTQIVEAKEHNLDGLVNSIVEEFADRK